MTRLPSKFLSAHKRLNTRQASLIGAGLAAVAIVVTISIFAAGTPTAFEAESGTVVAPAKSVAASGASGSSAVQFGTAVPTPTPAPGARTCPAYPAFPDASCTGVTPGATLTASGSVTVTTANAVIQNLDISGSVTIKAANVTIKNCKVHNTGAGPGISIQSGNAIITDSEIYGMDDEAIGFDNWAGYRLNIHSVADDGVKLGDNVTLQDSYMHDFTPAAGAHADMAQLQGGLSNVVVRHNNMNNPGGNSAMLLAPDLGPNGVGPITIDKNLFGGGNYTLYIVDGNNGQYHQKGYTVTNNHFLRNANYGPTDINEPANSFVTWSGNVYDDNGAVIGQ